MQIGNRNFVVHHDPSPSRIMALADNCKAYPIGGGVTRKLIRILHDPQDGSVHMWDGNEATHADVADQLGISQAKTGLRNYFVHLDSDGFRRFSSGMENTSFYPNLKSALKAKYPRPGTPLMAA